MPKFEKGSIEMKNYMAEMRAKRGTKPKVDKTDSHEHIKRVVNKALENYFISGTPIIEVPNKVVQVDKSGNAKLVTTLTKAGNLKKVKGENVIKLESGDNLVVKNIGKIYNDVIVSEPQTIVHKTVQNKIRTSIIPTEKQFNDILDSGTDIIPIQRITNTMPKTKRINSVNATEKEFDDILDNGTDIIPIQKNNTYYT